MEHAELIQSLNTELALSLPEQMAYDDLHHKLAAYINDLIKNDFEKLVTYLYRIDVNEAKLKSLLQQNQQEDAGNIIASLIIERQQQKIRTRRDSVNYQDSGQEDGIGEEKW